MGLQVVKAFAALHTCLSCAVHALDAPEAEIMWPLRPKSLAFHT